MLDLAIEKIFALKRRSKRLIQVLTDTFLITLCFFLAMWLRLDSLSFTLTIEPWLNLISTIPITIITFVKLGLYRAVVRYISSKALVAIGIGTLISANVMFIVSQVFSLQVPRSVPFIYFAILFLTVSGIRLALRQVYLSHRKIGYKPVAIYGAGEAGRQLLNALEQSVEYKPVLFIDDNSRLDGVQIGGLNVIPFEKASPKIGDLKLKAILLAMPSVPVSVRKNIIDQLEKLPIEVKTLPGMSELIEGQPKLKDLREVSIEDLLGRDTVPPMPELMGKNIYNKTVLITGAGGSIGSELCLQVIYQLPQRLLILDISEYSLYKIHQELERISIGLEHDLDLIPIVCSVQNKTAILRILDTFNVQTIYHAAAYKHVPLVELNVVEGIRNNVFGTNSLATAAIESKVESFILISTDKAVRPSNFMGASKRLAELICQTLSEENPSTCFSIVRFGNVLGSSGSVIPRFRKQISDGGPITVTHREVKRYFMTITEAAELVIQAGSMAKGGDLFVLDMGEPIKIIELAQKMARLHGLNPVINEGLKLNKGDISITITGLRPGEKLYEELLIGKEQIGTQHPRIMAANEESLSGSQLEKTLNELENAVKCHDIKRISEVILKAPTGFKPTGKSVDHVWQKMPNGRTKNYLKIIDTKS